MNILIINQPVGNRGDESAHKGLVRKLLNSIPGIQIKVLFVSILQNTIDQFAIDDERVEYINLLKRESNKKWISKNKLFNFIYSRWMKMQYKIFHYVATSSLQKDKYSLWNIHPSIKRAKSYYKEADLVLCAPGGICMGGFQNWYHLFFLKMAQRINKPIAYYGRSFGPFPTETKLNRKFKDISIDLLNYFSFISIRDKKTEMIAKELNIDYTPTVDSAFLDSTDEKLPKEIQYITEEPYIVFVPNLLIWHYAYKHIPKRTILSFYTELIDCIIRQFPNYKIVMLPQTFNSGIFNDIIFFKEIAERKKDKRIIVMPDKYSSDIQQAIIKRAQFMVGARYHSIVFSINQAIPFVALSYEHKIAGLLQILNKENCMIDITNIFEDKKMIEESIDKFNKMIQNIKADTLAQRTAKHKADKCFEAFINQLAIK